MRKRIEDRQQAVILYQQGALSVQQILDQTGLSKTVLYRELRSAGIPRDLASKKSRSSRSGARHARVYQARGSAQEQPCARHLELGVYVPAMDWAQIHSEDGMDPWADFVALCRSCHIRYDKDARAYTDELRAVRSAQMFQRLASGTAPRRKSLLRDPESGRFA